MDTGLYLRRIGFSGEPSPTLETLVQLQESHLVSVPFENLDIMSGRGIHLENVFEKIVLQNRGGFCYELNSLFFQLLQHLGYDAHMISARVYEKERGFGPEYDHLAIIARVENKSYLVDVGFGEFSLHPIPIVPGKELRDPRGIFRFEPYNEKYTLVAKKQGSGDFQPEYIFTKKPRALEEFQDMCHYHQSSSASHFTQKRICSLPTPDGRISLTGNILKITKNHAVVERRLKDENEVNDILKTVFKINR